MAQVSLGFYATRIILISYIIIDQGNPQFYHLLPISLHIVPYQKQPLTNPTYQLL